MFQTCVFPMKTRKLSQLFSGKTENVIGCDRCCLPGGTSLASHRAVRGSGIAITRGAGAAPAVPAPRDRPSWHQHRHFPGEQVNPAHNTGHPGCILSQEGGFVLRGIFEGVLGIGSCQQCQWLIAKLGLAGENSSSLLL